MKKNHLLAIVAGGLLLAGTASAQEKKIKRSTFPLPSKRDGCGRERRSNDSRVFDGKGKGQTFTKQK